MPEPEIEIGSREWEVARNRAELRGFTSEIMLSPANQALQADFATGMQQALFGPDSAAITVEGTDTRDNCRLGHIKFLARFAFLHLDEAADVNINRPFDLAVGVQAMHLNLEKLAGMSEEELKGMGYDAFDGVTIDLLDVLLKNHADKGLQYDSGGLRPGFRFHESGSGYEYRPGQTEDIVWSAYQIDTTYGFGTRRGPWLSTHLKELQVIVDILKHGEPDQAALDNVALASREGSAITLVDERSETAKKVLPYMYGMFKEAVEAPNLRDELARHQYLHAQNPGRLL